MPCYLPLEAYAAPGGISFDHSKSFGIPVQLPCGRCLGCRLEKAKQWAIRCYHESQMHQENCFITLTYDDEHLPPDGSLRKTDLQKFFRALRKKIHPHKFRYYACGEYGEKTHRPHYHAIVFGYKFQDARFVNLRKKNRVFRSELLERTWPHGSSEIGSVSYQSAGYVARYILKKQNGDNAREAYGYVDKETGELKMRCPPFTIMSLKPGIGATWFEKNIRDVFPHDYCVTPDGRTAPVPEFYRNLLKTIDPELHERLRKERIEKARSNPNNTPERLAVREACKNSQIKRLERNL